MKAKFITNPYFIYSLAFSFVLLFYQLAWSELYPNLSVALILFFFASIFISIIFCLYFNKINYFSYSNVTFNHKTLWLVTGFILLGNLIEFKYMGLVPLFAILQGSKYAYTDFGIPTFHVVLIVFNSFWAVFIFHNLVSSRQKNLIIPYLLCLLPSVLIFNRGNFLMIIASSIFISLMAAKKLKQLLLKVAIFSIIILFSFGIAGNIRVSKGKKTANDLILTLGRASTEFKDSPIPKEFFWAYLYTTSPIANLQQTLDKHDVTELSFEKVLIFINCEILPDFVSKRNKHLFQQREPIDQISNAFTVGSVYARSCAYFGYWGLIVMFGFIILFNILTIAMLNKNSIFFVTGIAILNSIMVFSIFDNMFTFAGLVLQLGFPLLFGFLIHQKMFIYNNTLIANK